MKKLTLFLLLILFGLITIDRPTASNYSQLIQNQSSLLRYVEAGYSPLGRAPVVDAILGDPFYLPTYANVVSNNLKKSQTFYEASSRSFIAGGIPATPIEPSIMAKTAPQQFSQSFGKWGLDIYALWKGFLQIDNEVKNLFSVLSDGEKAWLLENYEAFFFGKQGEQEYDFWTTNSSMPLKFFEMAARLDIAELAASARKLTLIIDKIHEMRPLIANMHLAEDFIWDEQDHRLIVSSQSHHTFFEEADFFLALGSHNTFKNRAGGARGSTALHISLGGHNKFVGDHFVQGSGFLGIGALANFGGHNNYEAISYSQGAGFMGIGLLMDLEGFNQYTLDFYGQSSATFGASLLWNPRGYSRYLAHDGFAQAASSTLGVAFLIDGGNSHFTAGIADNGGKRSSGIGQGCSMGVRHDPWIGHPSFYGGVSFLYAGHGQNSFENSWYSQGSAYFMGFGILVDEGSASHFQAQVDSQGQGLHLAAGLLLQKGEQNDFQGGFGSLGVAADRSIGMLLSLGGHNRYNGGVQSLGTSRKPEAVGILINLQGNNSYTFKDSSAGDVQKPASPLEWSKALFLSKSPNSFNGNEQYSEDANLTPHQLFTLFPVSARVPFAFDPIQGWESNNAYRPINVLQTEREFQDVVLQILNADYEERRRLYESLDLYRFTHPNSQLDLSHLLENPRTIPEDQFNYAALWALQNKPNIDLSEIISALQNRSIASSYVRQMAIRLVGDQDPLLLAELVISDSAPKNRAMAAYYLAKTPHLLKPALESPLEEVRYLAAQGLQDSSAPNALFLVSPLLNDPCFYVRRAAALTAISLGDKNAIPVLLETLHFVTLDTTENYGDNIYAKLAKYVGVDWGTNKEAWLNWWDKNQNSFEFIPSCLSTTP